MSEIEAPQEALLTASEMLLIARTAMGLSQKEVADQLFLTTTFIRYIDEGEFQKIPKAAFVKGYIRSYARVVGLDGNEVIAVFERDELSPAPSPAVGNVTEGPLEPTGFQGPIVQTGIFGLVGLVLVVLLVWWLVGGDDDEPATSQPATEISALSQEMSAGSSSRSASAVSPGASAEQLPERTSALAAVTGTPSAATQPSNSTPGATLEDSPGAAVTAPPTVSAVSALGAETRQLVAQESLPTQAAAGSSQVSSADAPPPVVSPTERRAPDRAPFAGESAGESARENVSGIGRDSASEAADGADEATAGSAGKGIAVERVVDGETTYVTVYASGDDEMQFSFSDECWVEIADGDGDKIYGDLNRAGDIMTIYGRAPFDVLLGRAPATSMTFQGNPVDLARFTTRDQTARVRTARL